MASWCCIAMPTIMSDTSKNDRSFFMELPTEVREIILRFLLATPYTILGYNAIRANEVSDPVP